LYISNPLHSSADRAVASRDTLREIAQSVYTIEMKVFGKRNKLITGLILMTVVAIIFLVLLRNYHAVQLEVMKPPVSALYLDQNQPIGARVADLLSYMTIEEKIGQMTLVEKNSIRQLGDISTSHLGALLSGAGAKPEVNTPQGWKEMIDSFQAEAKQSRLGIPLLYGVDAIHGHAHVPSATVFPHAIGLGATGNPELVKEIAEATAEELFATGVNWSFSPTLDQPLDIRWGRVYETFSDDTDLVSRLGVAYVEGLQGYGNSDNENIFILATPKHYLGLGSMEWDTSLNENFRIDQGVTPADELFLRSRYLPPFEVAIDAGALSIMVGLNTWGDRRMVLQKELLTDILKEELGFKGFLVSDWYGVHEGRRNTFWANVQTINAGVDMVMLPFEYEKFAREMKWAYRLGFITEERIDDAVSRILYAKFAMGLFDTDRIMMPNVTIPNEEHKILARTAVAQSLVLLKNQNELLPLSPATPHIRVAGSAADNVGRQVGAWTIEWQGVDGNWLPEAMSILEGIRQAVRPGVIVEYDVLGNFSTSTKRATVGIAIVGEKPYAEGWGDTDLPILSADDRQVIENLQNNSDYVVVVLVTGRPLLITHEFDALDALVVAWLPGSEGGGVADVLFGERPFVGTLPLSWPRTSEQLPLTPEGGAADMTPILFPRYFSID
jgi:beta-glucosidase